MEIDPLSLLHRVARSIRRQILFMLLLGQVNEGHVQPRKLFKR
jgi:hypothetical protein